MLQPTSAALLRILTCLLALCAACAITPSSDAALLRRIESAVKQEMDEQKIPAVGLAVVRGGEVLVARGFGLANLEHQVPASERTIFQSGSVGKQFTAVAVMLQFEDGKLALDDKLTQHFPDAPASWSAITVEHLLTHTSGIPDYTPQDVDFRRDYNDEELAQAAYKLPLEFAPGSRWNYSNTGYVLLGILVKKVSGEFYGDVLKSRVFAPLGMRTARVISERDLVPHRAAGYELDGEEWKNQEWVAPSLNTTADGALYLSIEDFIAWDAGLRAGKVLRPESWRRVFTPVKLTSGKSFPYGFGWSIDERGDAALIQHGGAWQGFKAMIARFMGADLTVIVLANVAQADPGAIVDAVAELCEPALARPALAPIEDREPEVTSRVRELLDQTARGALKPEDFAFVRAGFFPGAAQHFAKMLEPLGAPRELVLLKRSEFGDDTSYVYRVVFADVVLRVGVQFAPDGRLANFGVGQE